MLSCVINVMDDQDVATTNLPRAFLQTNMEVMVRVCLYGILSEILLNVDPERYRDKVLIERGKKLIYAVLKCALYGSLISSLIFWREILGKLNSWCFHTNHYDPCIMNKAVDRILCTVCWHVDNPNITNMRPSVFGGILQRLEEQYKKVEPLTTN